MKKRFYLLAALIGITLPMMAAIELSKSNPTYEQNFDGTATSEVLAVDEAALAAAQDSKRSCELAVPLPDGWKFRKGSERDAVGVYNSQNALTSTEFVGGTAIPSNGRNGAWNFGKIGDSDRAIGGVTSGAGTQSANVMVMITNTDPTETITSLDIAYAIEKYRRGTNTEGYTFALETSNTGDNGSWVLAGAPFSTSFPADASFSTADDEHLPISTTPVSGTLTVSIAPGASIYLDWHCAVSSGTTYSNSQVFALDDVVITANYGEVTPDPEPEPEPATPIASGELFGTYQEHDALLYKNDDMTDPQQIGVDFYIATCGQKVMLRAISTGETTFGGAGWETQLRRVNADGASQQEIQTCTNVSNKNHYTSGDCVRELNTTNEDIRFHFFVNGKYPAGVDGGYRKTTDFAFNRHSINNPIADAVAPVLDVENTTFVDNGDGTITITFGEVTADDEYFYYVADKDHNLGDISLDNTITLTKPNAQDGITYTLKAYAVDFNGNKSEAKEYSFTMPFDEELNLAENRPSYCGYQQQAGTGAEKANNTNLTDFWTCYGGPVADAWWKVDLLDTYDLTYIEMLWNDATGTYSILGSTDDINWASIVSGKAAPASKGGTSTDEITVSARYIKMQFSSSNIGLKNVIIQGTGIAAADHTAPTLSLSEVSKTVTTATIGLEYADLDDNGGAGQIVSIKISDTENGFAEREILSEISDGKITLSGLKDNTTYTFHVVVTDKAGNQTSKDLEVVLPFNTELNLALNKPADAGVSQGDGVKASKAVDNNTSTYWTSFGTGTADQWWWSVDLENLYQVNHIYILYNDHAGTYTLNYSADGSVWHEYQSGFSAQQVEGNYISDFTAPVVARYFRFTSTSANVGIKEFEVYGTGFAGADATAPVVTATMVENSATATSVKLHIEASDEDDNHVAQPMPTISITGNYGFNKIENAALDAEGNITLTDLIKNKRAYTFKVTATDLAGNKSAEKDVRVELPFDPTYDMGQNVEDKASAPSQVWAGATEGDNTAIKAVRESGYWGNYGKLEGTNEEKIAVNWWTIDLSVICEINYISIDFQTARKFDLLATFDNKEAVVAGTAKWFTVAENLSDADYEKVAPDFAARCIRIQSRSAEYMSINRVVIKADGRATTDAVDPQVTVTEVSKTKNTATLKIVATDVDDAGVAHPVKNIAISGDNGFETIENAVLDSEGNIQLTGLKDNATYNFHVTVTDRVGLTAEQDIEVRVAFNTETNLALAKNGATAVAGDAEVGHEAEDAIDGNATSYWGTYKQSGRDNWEEVNTLTITLAASYNINRIAIKTGGFDGNKHDATLEYSADGSDWTEFKAFAPFEANHVYDFPVVVTAQYLRLKATKNGMISIQEFEVYGSGYDDPDTEKPQITDAALVGEAGEDNATIAVTATDNVGVYACRFTDGSFSEVVDLVAGQCHVTGLVPGTTYTFSIIALDRAGNESEPFMMESFRTVGNDAVPHTAAPTPKQNAIDVTSIYSNAYTSAVKDGFSWKSWSDPTKVSHKTVGDNDYVHFVFTSHGEIGIGSNGGAGSFRGQAGYTTGENLGLNVSNRDYMHMDVWSYTGGTMNITLGNYNLATGIRLTEGEWTSIDLPLAEFAQGAHGDLLKNLEYIKFTGVQNLTLAVDNIYFWDELGAIIGDNVSNDSEIEQFKNRYVNVTLNRAFTSGLLHTLCLPFSMDEAQVEAAFGAGTEIWYLTHSEDRGSLIHADFEKQQSIEAGVPYLLRPTETFTSKTIEGVVIENQSEKVVAATEYVNMHGYINQKAFTAADNAYFLSDDQYLHKLTTTLTAPGLRSYFTFTGAAPAGAKARIQLGTNVVTEIENLNMNTNSGANKILRDGQIFILRGEKVYNLQGQLVK